MNLFSIKFPHQTINFSKQNRKNPQDIVVNGTIPKPIVPDISVKYENSVSNYKFGNIYGEIELFLNKNTYSDNQTSKASKAEKMSELDKACHPEEILKIYVDEDVEISSMMRKKVQHE